MNRDINTKFDGARCLESWSDEIEAGSDTVDMHYGANGDDAMARAIRELLHDGAMANFS